LIKAIDPNILNHILMRKIILFIIAGIVTFLSCKSYKQVNQAPETFYKNKAVVDAFTNYNVFIHDKKSSYYIESPEISAEGISGIVHPVSDSAAISKIKKPESRKEKRKHLYDLNIYTQSTIDHNQVASANGDKTIDEKIETKTNSVILKKEDISNISLNAVDKKGGFGIGGTALLAVLVVVLLIVVIAAALSAGSNSSSNSSGGSNSGGSNSGGSSSGSGNSGGSCYIATMVYGNYNAPEVMVLRRFRDNVLSSSIAGRLFIKYYYRYSPYFVEKFKDHKKINNIIKTILDKWTTHLSKKGI